jgi:hypothetical protein
MIWTKNNLIKFIFLIFLSSSIHAQINRNTVDVAISKVMSGQGVVSQAEYNEFWNTFNLSNKEKQEAINLLKSNFLDMLQFQKYIWKCTETAWKTKITPSCNNAFSLMNKIKENMSKGGADVTAMVHAEENSRRLLTAAASHGEVISSSNNQTIKLSLDLITQTSASLDGQFNRLNQVLRVKY